MSKLESLIVKAKGGDKSSLEKLIQSLMPLIIKESFKVYLKGYDRDDLIQIGTLSILKAIEKYDVDKQNFAGYAAMAIRNNFYYLIRKECKENYDISLNKEIGEDICIGDTIKSKENIEEDFIKKENYEKLYAALNALPREEVNILNWIYFKKKKVKDYAKIANITYGQARYLREKALKKLKEEFLNE